MIATKVHTIPAKSGTAFALKTGEYLKVICPEGEQVADMVCYDRGNIKEFLSNGKTFDYEERLLLTTGNTLFSNHSRPMLKIVADTCGVHDFLLAPCCPGTMAYFYDIQEEAPTCLSNLHNALREYGIEQWMLPTAFNIFMNVDISDPKKISVRPPIAKPGDYIVFEAQMDLIIGLTACSAAASNNNSFKDIQYEVLGHWEKECAAS